MASLSDVIEFILDHYPNESHTSNARVTKMIYLADWVHVINNGCQITGVRWFFDNFGPFVWDVRDAARDDPDRFESLETENMYGHRKVQLRLKTARGTSLTQSESDAIRHVIQVTKDMNWDQFMKLVYSTHPILSADRYTYLDLPSFANTYHKSSA